LGGAITRNCAQLWRSRISILPCAPSYLAIGIYGSAPGRRPYQVSVQRAPRFLMNQLPRFSNQPCRCSACGCCSISGLDRGPPTKAACLQNTPGALYSRRPDPRSPQSLHIHQPACVSYHPSDAGLCQSQRCSSTAKTIPLGAAPIDSSS
jgi:hypothetical protein